MTYIFLILLIVFDLHKCEVARNDTEVAIYQFDLPKAKAEPEKQGFYQSRISAHLYFCLGCSIQKIQYCFLIMM